MVFDRTSRLFNTIAFFTAINALLLVLRTQVTFLGGITIQELLIRTVQVNNNQKDFLLLIPITFVLIYLRLAYLSKYKHSKLAAEIGVSLYIADTLLIFALISISKNPTSYYIDLFVHGYFLYLFYQVWKENK